MKTIAITLGDIAGIGPEVVCKALCSRKLPRHFHYKVLLADQAPKVSPGKPSRVAARFAWKSLEHGVEGCLRRDYAALVTAPVNKAALQEIGFRFAGQTEWLAHRTGAKRFAMMLVGGNLRVALVTTHVPLRKVALLITQKSVYQTIELTYETLRHFGIRKPRILVAGLNPHAGVVAERGLEETKVIAPAVRTSQRRFGDGISGPHSPDSIFWRARQDKADAVVCMYHDQGLIPIKMLAFDRGVNITLGLPIIRASPDHGTAYEIAGKSRADPTSMIEAIRLATWLSSHLPMDKKS